MLKLHCFPNENAPLTQLAADVRTSMLLRGVDTLSQLRTFFLLGRLRDAAVAQWRLEAAWACSNSDDLARFIREAPSTKRPGSTEIGLMGKNSRNSAAAVPLWEDLFERPGSWSLCFSAAAARGYAQAVQVTKEKVSGLDYYVAKKVDDYDDDDDDGDRMIMMMTMMMMMMMMMVMMMMMMMMMMIIIIMMMIIIIMTISVTRTPPTLEPVMAASTGRGWER